MNFKKNETSQKLRGGYYTPYYLAQYLVKWVKEIEPRKILEPSCGDGIFIEAIAKELNTKTQLTAIELDVKEANKARTRTSIFTNMETTIICTDFLEWSLKPSTKPEFDAIVGNPPFIRYQYLSKKDQEYAEQIFRNRNLTFTKHTNAWVSFVIASMELLKPGGRLAMVIPSEILHVLHANSLRKYLGKECRKITIIDPEEIWFDNTLQGAVLILAEKKENPNQITKGVGIVSVKGREFLRKNPRTIIKQAFPINGNTLKEKWTIALLTKEEIELISEIKSHRDVKQFSEIAKVDVGLVTGANNFFLVPDSTVEQYGLQNWAHPMFGRSQHCPGIIYDEKQHQQNTDKGLPSNFLWFNVNDEKQLHIKAKQYLRNGEIEGLHLRYKCRIRKPWYKVPSVYSTQIGMLKRAHNIPRLILNEIDAYTTDTAYRIQTNDINPKKLVFCFVNSLTALSAELEGRYYGGGVLELVPSEIEKLVIPIPKIERLALRSLDQMYRDSNVSEVLELQDKKILGQLGLSNNEIVIVRNACHKLRYRRQRKSHN